VTVLSNSYVNDDGRREETHLWIVDPGGAKAAIVGIQVVNPKQLSNPAKNCGAVGAIFGEDCMGRVDRQRSHWA
jgi:hypothetical protein